MSSFSAEDGRRPSQEKDREKGIKPWIIIALFLLALISISLFFILRVTVENVP